jgi:hypothetical protein
MEFEWKAQLAENKQFQALFACKYRYNSSISRDKQLQMIKQQHQCNKVRPMVVADTHPSMDRLSGTITVI